MSSAREPHPGAGSGTAAFGDPEDSGLKIWFPLQPLVGGCNGDTEGWGLGYCHQSWTLSEDLGPGASSHSSYSFANVLPTSREGVDQSGEKEQWGNQGCLQRTHTQTLVWGRGTGKEGVLPNLMWL